MKLTAAAGLAWTDDFWEWLKGIGTLPFRLVNMLPIVPRLMVYAVFCLALFGIGVTHVKAIMLNRGRWMRKDGSDLFFGYFFGTGKLQHASIYNDAHRLLRDRTWLLISAAGAAYYMENHRPASKLKAFSLSLIRLPLAAIGFFEMLIRVGLGFVYLWAAWGIHWVLLTVLQGLSWLLIPVWGVIDRRMRVEQHCPHCYLTFRVPGYLCPECGRIHKDLVPGKTGILTARCRCGKFLPAALLTGRSRLDSVCPKCGRPLATAGAREFSLQLIGGNNSGKTAYLAAFQHIYRMWGGKGGRVEIRPFPEESFQELEHMYMGGYTLESSKTSARTYSMVHRYRNGKKDSIVIYDIPDEVLISGIYEQNPLNFAYSNGILIVFDPASMRSVRRENERLGERIPEGSYSPEESETEDVITEFIQQFSRLNNRSSSRMTKTPLAVLVNKTDLRSVSRRVGKEAVGRKYRSDPAAFGNDIQAAESRLCREYLILLGLSNVVNNLESVFSNIRYFSVSAMGHAQKENVPFAPAGIMEPIIWIGRRNRWRPELLQKVSGETAGTARPERGTAQKGT